MQKDLSREETQWLVPLSQMVSYFHLSENKFLFAGYFPHDSYLCRGDLGNRYTGKNRNTSSFQKKKNLITVQHATKEYDQCC